jgi:hypothetical protein
MTVKHLVFGVRTMLCFGRIDLLASGFGFMTGVHFEPAIFCPQLNRVGDGGHAALIDLMKLIRPVTKRTDRIRTSSAVSVPPMPNSRSAYFFQYAKNRGNLARKQS